MKIIITLLLLFAIQPLVFSQGEFHTWYFGYHPGVSFNTTPPTALTNINFSAQFNSTSISDSTGSFLFYSNGANIYDRSFNIMPNGSNLSGLAGLTNQPVFSIQSLADDSIYYIFTIDSYSWPYILPHSGFRYSILNMRLNGSLGDIDGTHKNILIPSAYYASSAINACRAHNNKDAWVVVRINDVSNRFATYKITQSGLDTIPVYSSSIVPHLTLTNGNSIAYIKISPDGNKLVATYSNLLEVCNFDDNSGAVQPLFTFTRPANTNLQAGCEFSPDGKLLYVQYWYPSQGIAKIFQYDARKTDSASFKSTEVIIGTRPNAHLSFQRAPDYKIYFSMTSVLTN